MIKRLQLRGISRNPSDRYTEDGGCAESLNVFIDNNETAPALRPVVVNDMTDKEGRVMFPPDNWNYPWEAVFIHKTPNHIRAIIKYQEELYTKLGVWNPEENKCDPFLSFEIGVHEREEFVQCINLGNSLSVVTKKITRDGEEIQTYWVLLKDGEYKLLGSKIPFPAFTIANYDVSGGDVVRSKEVWHYIEDDSEAPKKSGLSTESLQWLNEEIDLAVAENQRQGVYNRQMFAVLAVRLFDGTRIISTPVLIAPGFDNPYLITDYDWDHTGSRRLEQATIKLMMAYKIFFRLDSPVDFYNQWEDIVDSFEIYLSPQIDVDRSKSYFKDGQYHASGNPVTEVTGSPTLGNGSSPLQKLLDASNFYRVYSATYNASSLATLTNGLVLDTTDYMSTDSLVTAGIRLDTLSDMKHYDVRYTKATLYNNKIIASGISEKVQMELNVPIAKNYLNQSIYYPYTPTHTYNYDNGTILAYKMTFHLRDSSGHSFSIKATNAGSEYFEFGAETLNGQQFNSDGYGMIFCPDVRAFAVDVSAYYGTRSQVLSGDGAFLGGTTLSMTPHPNLDCSYWYGDITKELIDYCTQNVEYVAGDESYVDNRPNKVYASEMDNPFVFPTASRYTFNSRVLGTAIATNALSTGQFGQFPIYVFTEDGIWAMESASDGTIVSTKPLSREVCSNPDSITPIDNAVVFITEKTVMLISGSQITDLSPFMNGEHYALNPESREAILINTGDWSPFMNTLMDDTHFMAFMENARIGYDYKGNRLVFINENETYQYVFMLKTNTWHKVFVDGYGSTLSISNVLNAYPDTYVNAQASNRHYVWDLSSKLDVTSSESLKGVIITRPFDLGEPDVRKGLRDIRIRGRYNRTDARYILLGSMDCINWGVLPSLHGGSYKWFRLIVLTNLSPTERISWIDVDYDTRMQNKLR